MKPQQKINSFWGIFKYILTSADSVKIIFKFIITFTTNVENFKLFDHFI